MLNIVYSQLICICAILVSAACQSPSSTPGTSDGIASFRHDLSYIQFNPAVDDPNYVVCDSNRIGSGRNRLQYIGGTEKLRRDIATGFNEMTFDSFDGYVVVRFLHNCEGKSGRYRGQALNLDFSPAKLQPSFVEYSVKVIQDLEDWNKSKEHGARTEYSKYINLKIKNGRLEHVLL